MQLGEQYFNWNDGFKLVSESIQIWENGKNSLLDIESLSTWTKRGNITRDSKVSQWVREATERLF